MSYRGDDKLLFGRILGVPPGFEQGDRKAASLSNLEPALPADPLDELQRNVIFDDCDSKDTMIVEHFACGDPRILYASVGPGGFEQRGRRSLHHGREEPVPTLR